MKKDFKFLYVYLITIKERLKNNHPMKGKIGTRNGVKLSDETKEKMRKSAKNRLL